MPNRIPSHRPHKLPRPKTASRGYGWQWQRARDVYLAAHPLCAECRRNGIVASAVLVDHIIPHKGDQFLFWDEGNWQSLCKPCHDRKTAIEDGGFGNVAHR